MNTSNIDKTSRMAIRKLVKVVKYYARTQDCEKDCRCDACAAIWYAKKEDAKLTYIIETNRKVREMVSLRR